MARHLRPAPDAPCPALPSPPKPGPVLTPLLPHSHPTPPPPQTSTFRKELEDLREMKEDVERREKAQAEVISQQVRPAFAAG